MEPIHFIQLWDGIMVPEDPDILQENPAEDVPEPEGEPLDPDLWPEASASLAA